MIDDLRAEGLFAFAGGLVCGRRFEQFGLSDGRQILANVMLFRFGSLGSRVNKPAQDKPVAVELAMDCHGLWHGGIGGALYTLARCQIAAPHFAGTI